jgi:hypothetical protein
MLETDKMRISNLLYVVWVVVFLLLVFSVSILLRAVPFHVGALLIILALVTPFVCYQLLKRKTVLEIRNIRLSKEEWHGSVGYRIKAEVVCKDKKVRDLTPSVDVRNYGERVPIVTLTYSKSDGKEEVSPAVIKWKNAVHAWSQTLEEKDMQKGKWRELQRSDELHLIFPDPAGDGFAIGDSLHWEKQFLKLEPMKKYHVLVEVGGINGKGNLVEEKKKTVVTA